MRRFDICLFAYLFVLLTTLWWNTRNGPEPSRATPVPVAGAGVVWVEPPQDIGRSLHEFGRPCLFDSKEHRLGNTAYVASFGPNYYEDVPERGPAFYSIQVCLMPNSPLPPEVISVLYWRYFRVDELPADLLARSPAEIVTFNPDTSIVTFLVGEKPVTFKLP